MPQPWLATNGPPMCPSCGGTVTLVTTTVSTVRRARSGYITRPAVRSEHYECTACGAQLRAPDNTVITDPTRSNPDG